MNEVLRDPVLPVTGDTVPEDAVTLPRICHLQVFPQVSVPGCSGNHSTAFHNPHRGLGGHRMWDLGLLVGLGLSGMP